MLLAGRFLTCFYGGSSQQDTCSGFGINVGIMMLFMESLLFFMFTTCMMADQAAGALTNQTQIDRLKNEKHDTGVEFNEVFGSVSDKAQLHWIFPVPVSFPAGIRDRLFGYRLPNEDDESDDEDEEACDVEKETSALISGNGALASDGGASEQPSGGGIPVDIEKASVGDTVSGRYEVPPGNVRKRGGPP